MTAPPVLTPERIDQMLSIMAEVCLEAVVETGRRQKTADSFEDFERAGRTLQRTCRNLRQTIALKQRFDRDEAAKAREARDAAIAAEAVRKAQEDRRRERVDIRSVMIRGHFEPLWNEYEAGEAQAHLDDLEERLHDLADEPDFLETTIDKVIARLAADIGVPDPLAEPERPRATKPRRAERAGRATPAEPPEPSATSAFPSASSAVQSNGAAPEPSPEMPPEPPAQAQPPPAPPPPEPYIPPWERLAPGQPMPGGGGW